MRLRASENGLNWVNFFTVLDEMAEDPLFESLFQRALVRAFGTHDDPDPMLRGVHALNVQLLRRLSLRPKHDIKWYGGGFVIIRKRGEYETHHPESQRSQVQAPD